MEVSLFISSENRSEGEAHNFKLNFYPIFNLDNWKTNDIKTWQKKDKTTLYQVGGMEKTSWSMALSYLNMTYSWYNVTPELKNNELKYSKDSGSNWVKITIPSGVYSYNDLQIFINEETGESNKIRFNFLYTRHKIKIELDSGYQLDLSEGEFAKLLGFDKKVIITSEVGAYKPNITNSIDNIHICVNKVRNFSPIDPLLNDSLFSFNTGNLRRAFVFEKEPKHLLFRPIKDPYFDSLLIYVKDDKGNLVNLNNIDWNMKIVLRKDGFTKFSN